MVSTGGVDPALVAIIAVLLLVVLGIYLFVRRTLLAFTDGLREGSKRD